MGNQRTYRDGRGDYSPNRRRYLKKSKDFR
jgi:hypothetical protein